MGVAVRSRGGILFVKGEGIGAFGEFDADVVFGAFSGVVLG